MESGTRVTLRPYLSLLIIATLAETRCIAMNNSTRKVEGVYNSWLRENYNVKVVSEAYQLPEAIKDMLGSQRISYDARQWDKWRIALAAKIKNFIGEA